LSKIHTIGLGKNFSKLVQTDKEWTIFFVRRRGANFVSGRRNKCQPKAKK